MTLGKEKSLSTRRSFQNCPCAKQKSCFAIIVYREHKGRGNKQEQFLKMKVDTPFFLLQILKAFNTHYFLFFTFIFLYIVKFYLFRI